MLCWSLLSQFYWIVLICLFIYLFHNNLRNIVVLQLLHGVVDDVPSVAFSVPSKDLCMELAFSSLYCGVYHGKSNGDIMVY